MEALLSVGVGLIPLALVFGRAIAIMSALPPITMSASATILCALRPKGDNAKIGQTSLRLKPLDLSEKAKELNP